MKNKFLLLLLIPFSTSVLFAEPPGVASNPMACSTEDYATTCPLIDFNATNQPLDTETRGFAIPNRLIESDMNMFMNPGQLMNYGTAYLEGWLGGNLVWGGATVPLPANQKLAVFVRRPLNTNSPLGATQALFNKYTQNPFLTGGGAGFDGSFTGDDLKILEANTKGFGNLDAMYGMAMGDFNIGVRLSYANLRNNVSQNTVLTNTNSKYKMSAHNIGIGLGVQWKNLGPGYLDVSLSSDLPFVNIDYNTTTPTGSENLTIKSTAAPSLSLLGRYVMPVGQDRLLVAVNIDQYKVPYEVRGTELVGATKSEDLAVSAFNIQADAAYHQMFQDGKLKVIYSAGIGRTSVSYTNVSNSNPAALDSSYEVSHIFIPVGVAVEHKTFETLKTRMGVRKNVFSSRDTIDKDVAQKTEVSRSFYGDDELVVAMGFGWVPAEKVNVDFVMNANAFNLTTFFSGVSVRYHY